MRWRRLRRHPGGGMGGGCAAHPGGGMGGGCAVHGGGCGGHPGGCGGGGCGAIEVAEVAAAVAWASAWAWGLEAAAGAVEATEPAGNGTRSCSIGSTSASNSRDVMMEPATE